MSKKTDSFLNDLVNLCVSHGVRLRGSDGSFLFEGNGVKPTPVSKVAQELRFAFDDCRDSGLVQIYRDRAELGRRWLNGEKQWLKDRDKARPKILSLPQAKRLIRSLKKLPGGGDYGYGIESLWGRNSIVFK
ncbi:MAG: hypothetical protein JF599_11310 [Verrucomicrobia bacterium]|nr:hypothetical protein [Verrucomicrobiota bacterium]